MNGIAITALLFLSYILGVGTYPSTNQYQWEIVNAWEKTADGYYFFSAQNGHIAKECKDNPSFYIEFPSIIHSSTRLKVGDNIVSEIGSQDFEHIRGFYGALIIPCSQFRGTEVLTWEVISYTKYFARFHYFPRVVDHYPRVNFFNETLNVAAAGALLLLSLLYLVLFTGKIPVKKQITLIFSNLFTSVYFIANSAELMGLSLSMLTAHKIADSGLWIGFSLFTYFLYLERLILRWMSIVYAIAASIAIIVISTASTGDVIQLGTSIPFLFTIAFPGYAIIGLLKKRKLESKQAAIQLIALLSAFLVYFNDVFVVMGVIDFYPLLPLGVTASYVFILLSVNESITNTYAERDQLKTLTEQLKQTNINLNRAQDELIKSEKMAVIGRAVAQITHELNNPLYSARTSSQNIEELTKRFLKSSDVIDKEGFVEKVKQYQANVGKMLTNLMISINRAAELVKNFKEIAHDQVNIQKREFQLIEYIKKGIDSHSDELRRSKITVELKGNEVTLYNDKSLFYRIIQNLLTNVQKYAYEPDIGGEVSIEIKEAGDDVIIIFSDYGKGITPENLPRIFDDFFTTGGGLGGMGVGLGMVYRDVTIKLKGKIVCESTVDKGTTFTITVPK